MVLNLQLPHITLPTLVRMKPGALERLGIYLTRYGLRNVGLLSSAGLVRPIMKCVRRALDEAGLEVVSDIEVSDASFEGAAALFGALHPRCQVVVGLGGGRALDVAKCVASLGMLPFCCVPTSLSHDGFASPQASLFIAGKRRSLPTRVPFGIVVDTEQCLEAPEMLWWSGVGDLVSKVTAVADWKLAFHRAGTPFDDFAALLSDATVFQFMARPVRDLEGMRLLASALMFNGVAMQVAGSSRPASGSEHLISHALDALAARPRLHGLQVGVASYIVAHLQGQGVERIGRVLDETGFFRAIEPDPFSRAEWMAAVATAPSIKADFYTILSERDCRLEVEQLLSNDPRLRGCFVA